MIEKIELNNVSYKIKGQHFHYKYTPSQQLPHAFSRHFIWMIIYTDSPLRDQNHEWIKWILFSIDIILLIVLYVNCTFMFVFALFGTTGEI